MDDEDTQDTLSTPGLDRESVTDALNLTASELEHEKNHALFLGYKVEEIQPNVLLLSPDSASRLTWWWLIKRSHGALAKKFISVPRFSADRYDTLDFINIFNCHCELLCATLQESENRTPQIFAHSFLEGEYNRGQVMAASVQSTGKATTRTEQASTI
jgi:hypothetical protein